MLEFATGGAWVRSEGYRWNNNGVLHLASRARVRILSSDARRALGPRRVTIRLLIADEGPGAWSPIQGRRLWDAMLTSLGKRRTQIIVVGTLAPSALDGAGSVVAGNRKTGGVPATGDTSRYAASGPGEAGETSAKCLRVNPVAAVNPLLAAKRSRAGAPCGA